MEVKFTVSPSDLFAQIDPQSSQIVFHAMNKSGSLAMSNAIRDAYKLQNREHELFGHYFTGGSTEEYIKLTEARRAPSFLLGHYLYGALRPAPNRVWITQVRHPLPRILSCYNWLKNKSHARDPATPFPSIETWVKSSKGKSHSMIAEFGAGHGKHRKTILARLEPRDLYEISIDCMDRDVMCIGVAEYLEESIFLFSLLAGLTSVAPWRRDKRNPGRLLSSEVSNSLKDLVAEVYQYDFLLYDYALDRLKKQVEAANFGESLHFYKEACSAEYNDRII